MSCTHSVERSKWVLRDEDATWGDSSSGDWEWWTENTTEDIDLHRYRCTQCKKVMYYSGRARAYYEDGVTSDVKGLDR